MKGATVKGAKSLDRKLANLARQADGQTLKRALVAGGLLIQNQAKANAPYITGNLRRSIHIGGAEDLNPEGANVSERTLEPVPEPEIGKYAAAVYVGTDVEYAAPVELGTARRPPHPYLRPAFDSEKDAAMQEVADSLQVLIQAAAR